MNLHTVWNVLGRLALIYAAVLLVPLAVSLGYWHVHPEMNEPLAFLVAAVVTALVGLLLRWRFPGDLSRFGHREGFAVVAFSWLGLSIFGAIPYLVIGGTMPDGDVPLRLSLVDAFFETMSGLTTTGATILTDIEAYGHGILLYRAMTQWIGGMGIIMLTIAILPGLGAGGYQMMRFEGIGPSADKIAPRIAQTARVLWGVYLMLTLMQIILLWAPGWFFDVTRAGEAPPEQIAAEADEDDAPPPYVHYRSGASYPNLYEAVCHAMTTLPSGGFSTRNESAGAFAPYVQYIIIVFMFLSGLNFVLQYQVLAGRPRLMFQNSEVRMYATVVLVAAIAVSLTLLLLPVEPGQADDRAGAERVFGSGSWPERDEGLHEAAPEKYERFESNVRHGLFNVVAIVTTTGFASADFDKWPDTARILLVILMLMGACAGSTSGSLKQIRILVVLKHAFVEVQRLVFPHRVVHVKVQGQRVQERVLAAIIGAFTLFLLLLLLGTFAFSLMPGFDLITAFSCAVATTCNIGPGLGAIGPMENFAWIPDIGKILCALLMLLGRLEVYTVLVLLLPAMYRR